MDNATVPATEIRELSLEVMLRLEVIEEEMEVTYGEIDYLVELAQGGEVLPIDLSDPAGGFGPPDLWIATVVPAVATVLAARRAGLDDAAIAEQVAEIVRRVRSPRAKRERERLLALLLEIVSRPE